MLSLLSEIRFWSTQDDIQIDPKDYSCFKYQLKKEPSDQKYGICKRNYADLRGYKTIVPNKRPEKLKDKLKEFEDALSQNRIICSTWDEMTLKLVLSKGLIVHIKVDGNDIEAITFDKNLAAKVQPEIVYDALIKGNQVICACKDGRVIGYGGNWKEWIIDGGHRRNLSLHGELLAVWGRSGSNNPQPWTPVAKDHQRANLHLYWLGARGPDLISYRKTDGEPIKIIVSTIDPKCLIVIEQKVSQRGAVSIEVCVLELVGTTLKRSTVTSVPLQTQVCSTALSIKETYLVLGCIDGSLALLDRNKGSSSIIKASFIPMHAAWHESEALFAVSNERGQVQYYDVALNCLNTQLMSEETANNLLNISSYFNTQCSVESIFWGPETLFVELEQGPLIALTHIPNSLKFQSLIRMYLHETKYEKAIRLLLNWDFDEQAFAALQLIVAQIMREPLNEVSAKMLQDALGSFHSPSVPLRVEVRHKFGAQVKSLTRKFFHQLVRAKMYETSFLLAVDLGHHDLFMDLHFIAVKIGETEMAAAARAQASALISRCSSEASNCSRSICSQCSDSSSSHSSEEVPSPRSQHANENYLSTNFNTPIPKTYRPPFVPPIPTIDLPKIKLSVKPAVVAPPLPSTPPLPMSGINNLGIPFTIRPTIPQFRPINNNNNPPVFNYPMETRFIPIRTPISPLRAPLRIAQPLRVAPPLPITPLSTPQVMQPQASVATKKPQAKVKFSDTVTAFIVPEVKRPVRVPPPAHVTDPQKELADSLPLCHPNEDYLKDFTPIRKDSGDSPPTQPKIKVVHFGVV